MDLKKAAVTVILLLPASLFAQLDSLPSYKLSEIVVSATKTKTSELLIANSVSVIDSAEIYLRSKSTLLDLLKSEYGLSFTNEGNPGSNSFVNIRGAGTGHTLVIIDGMIMNRTTDPGGTFDFSTIVPDNIERIEILRGPQSTLYGSDALAGVINIFTKKGSPGLRLNLSSEGGSYNTFKGNAALSGGKGILNFNLNFSRAVSDGFSAAAESYGNTEKDGYRNAAVNASAGLKFSDELEFNFRYDFIKALAELDWAGGYSGDQYTYTSSTEESGFGLLGNFKPAGFWDQTAAVSLRKNLRKYDYQYQANSGGPSHSRYDGSRLDISWQNNFRIPGNIITAGVEYQDSKMNSEYYDFTPGAAYNSIFPSESNNIYGIFLQDQLNVSTFFASAGIRLDNNKLFGSEITYRLAPAYLIKESGTKIKATYGTGYKAPSLYYLYDPVFGSSSLKPEKSRGWDAGIEQYFFALPASVGITYFSIQFYDMLAYSTVTFKPGNINRASSRGLEIYFSAEPMNNLKVQGNYTFTEPREETASFNGLNYTRKPKHKAALNVDYVFIENAYAGAEIIYNGKRTDKYFSSETFAQQEMLLDDYIMLNFTASYKMFDKLNIYTRLENVLNKKYQLVYGYGVPAFSVYAGVKVDTGNIFSW